MSDSIQILIKIETVDLQSYIYLNIKIHEHEQYQESTLPFQEVSQLQWNFRCF